MCWWYGYLICRCRFHTVQYGTATTSYAAPVIPASAVPRLVHSRNVQRDAVVPWASLPRHLRPSVASTATIHYT